MKNPLMAVPGIGKEISKDLNEIGIYSVEELKKEDPEILYQKLCTKQGMTIDRCMLYTMRCAVYYATEKNPKPELLKWWNWMDKK